MERGFLRHTPMGRFGEADDIAQRSCTSLRRSLRPGVTGHTLAADGGQSLRGLPLYLENLMAP